MSPENCPFDPLAPIDKELPLEKRQKLSFAQFLVNGMGCAGCESKIYNSLMALEGIASVDVSREKKKVEVVFNPAFVNISAMTEAISRASGEGSQNYQAYRIG
jgi:copper chaperone CopZ